jgi:hypothetical protein
MFSFFSASVNYFFLEQKVENRWHKLKTRKTKAVKLLRTTTAMKSGEPKG